MNDQAVNFNLPPRYTDVTYIGHGSFGVVVSATDTVRNEEVAIKKISHFEHKTLCQTTLREISILKRFDHENVTKILNSWVTAENGQPRVIYIVQCLMETDLHRLLRQQTLGNDHVCYFLYQILRGLKYIHSANVMHRDLKPSNILLNHDCDLKICDFGSARVVDPRRNHDRLLSEYVSTRWYRAPEIMLNSRDYDKNVDVWSVGCILGEMLDNQYMFPGNNYLEQIKLIFNVIGTPNEEDSEWVHNPEARRYMLSFPEITRQPWAVRYPSYRDSDALDIIDRLLTFNPFTRITVDQALVHPYLERYNDPEDEPVCSSPLNIDLEYDNLSIEQLKLLILQEANSMNENEPS